MAGVGPPTGGAATGSTAMNFVASATMWPSYLLLRYASCLPHVGMPCGTPLVEQVPILMSL